MKKNKTPTYIIKLIVLITLILIIFILAVNGLSTKPKYTDANLIPHECKPTQIFIPDQGCVPDSITAIKIAEIVLVSLYGDEINKRKPLSAELIEDSIWVIAGTIPKDMLGGVPYIEIQKKDSRVLGIGHGS